VSHIDIFFENTAAFDPDRNELFEQIRFLIGNEGKKQGDLSIIFCDDETLLDINKQYLDHDFYTDIVTFDYVKGGVISGDLFISVDRVHENAGIFKRPFTEELHRVIIHGILHLTGYADHSEEEKRLMRERENFYLQGFKQEKE
jgi:probable rRNA maturation factor